jgi:hypothetical protein
MVAFWVKPHSASTLTLALDMATGVYRKAARHRRQTQSQTKLKLQTGWYMLMLMITIMEIINHSPWCPT